jgi:hypothetical protein
MPAGIGRKYIGDMFAAIGSRTKAGKAISSGARAMAATAPAGMVTPAAMSAHMRPGHIKAGKRIAAHGAYGVMGASGMNMAYSNRRGNSYRPPSQPINPISSPQGSGRYA